MGVLAYVNVACAHLSFSGLLSNDSEEEDERQDLVVMRTVPADTFMRE